MTFATLQYWIVGQTSQSAKIRPATIDLLGHCQLCAALATCRPPLLLPLAPPRPCDLPTEDKTSRRDLVGNNQSTRCLSVKSHACGVELGSALKCVRKSAAVPATRNVPKDSASITPPQNVVEFYRRGPTCTEQPEFECMQNNWYDLFHVVKDRVVADNKMANSTIIMQPVCKFGAVHARAYTINDLCRRFNAREFARHEQCRASRFTGGCRCR